MRETFPPEGVSRLVRHNSRLMRRFWNDLSPCGGRHTAIAAAAHTVSMIVVMKPPPSMLTLKNYPWLVAGLLGLVTALVFLPAVSYDFVNWDDNRYVYDNPLVLGGLSPAGAFDAVTQTVFGFWAPLTILSYQLDASVFGKAPWGFHLTNVLLHAASAACLFIVLARMTGCLGRSAVATLLFAMHPLRVESVAWVAERKDVLCMLLTIATIMAYERYCRAPSMPRYLLVMAALLASLMAKAMAVTLPVLLLLLDWWPLERVVAPRSNTPINGRARHSPYPVQSPQAVLAEKIPLLIVAGLFVLITLKTHAGAVTSDVESPLLTKRLPHAVFSTTWYLWKTVWPADLHPAHLAAEATQPWWIVALCACLLGAMGTACVWCAKQLPAVSMGLAWFAIALLPILGVVAQVGIAAFADRFTYLPHIGLAIAIAWGGWAIAQRLHMSPRIVVTVVAMVVIGLVIRSESQLPIWQNSATLWKHVLVLDPSSPDAHYNLGRSLEDQGQSEEAVAHYAQALVADPAYLPARNNLAAILIERGAIADARPHVERALRGKPDTLTFINLGMLLMADGNAEKAAAAAGEAIRIDPASASAYFLLGRTLVAQGLMEPAIAAYAQAVRFDPDNLQARNNLANLLARLRRFDEAIPLYRSILDRDPQVDVARRNLAAALEAQSRGPVAESTPSR